MHFSHIFIPVILDESAIFLLFTTLKVTIVAAIGAPLAALIQKIKKNKKIPPKITVIDDKSAAHKLTETDSSDPPN